jgi:hypothetical protein
MGEVFSYLVSDWGILGVLLVLSISANIYQYITNQKLMNTFISIQDKRVEDARDDRSKVVLALTSATKATEENTQVISDFLREIS